MYMPFMIDVSRAVVFGGERDEGLQKTEKMAVFADELLVVPESTEAPSEIVLEKGPLNRVPESLSLDETRRIPVADQPASEETLGDYIEGATFVTSDLEDESLNRSIQEACEERNILCNIIDVKELCNTWFMSVIDEPNMIAGISSKGGCAFYSQRTRIELEEQFRKRSEVSNVFTEMRDHLREEQCNLCALTVVYEEDQIQELMEQENWDEVLRVGKERASEVPDNYHVKDHSVSDPDD
jgi:precorrin-2 dehydrogenase/sirohydrochlorin ferrochelatase